MTNVKFNELMLRFYAWVEQDETRRMKVNHAFEFYFQHPWLRINFPHAQYFVLGSYFSNNMMNEETKQKLRDAGRQDLIDTHDILTSGYAGVNKIGQIVDRRKFPDAVPIPYSSVFPDTPHPKPLPEQGAGDDYPVIE